VRDRNGRLCVRRDGAGVGGRSYGSRRQGR
jgi:hypothetical protein